MTKIDNGIGDSLCCLINPQHYCLICGKKWCKPCWDKIDHDVFASSGSTHYSALYPTTKDMLARQAISAGNYTCDGDR